MRTLGKFFWRFMVIYSFIVTLVLVVVLIVVGLLIFDIKKNIADPLIGGLHTTAEGLGGATIDWTIPVRDSIDISLDVPINENTILSQVTELRGEAVQPIKGETKVVLTRAVPLTVTAKIDLPGVGTLNNAQVNLSLPAGLELPVKLDLAVGLDTEIPVNLDVRAVIPLAETQLIDPIDTLGNLFEPLAIGLHNLPNNFGEAGSLVGKVLGGEPLETLLLSPDGGGFNAQAYTPWPGYSRTAGENYDLLDEPIPAANQTRETGIVPLGGIPLLDSILRPDFYANDTSPAQINAQARANLDAQGVNAVTYNGQMAAYYESQQLVNQPSNQAITTSDPNALPTLDPAIGGFGGSSGGPGDLGIIQPTPGAP